MNYALIIPALIDALVLAYLGLEDRRNLAVRNWRLAEIIMLAGIPLLAYLDWQVAFLQILIGLALYFTLRNQFRKLFASLDGELILIALVTATVPAIIALLAFFAYHSIRAYFSPGKVYPVLFDLSIAFCIGTLIFLIAQF